jgi:streptogramin lyase
MSRHDSTKGATTVRNFHVIALVSSVAVLSGCTAAPVMTTTSTQPNQVQGAALHGRVHGGQQPIVGASVYLYAANTTGYAGAGIPASSGNASVSLLKSPGYVTTDSNGDFSISGDYTCTSASTQVYLYSIGGNPGAGTNSAAGLLAGLGSCGSLTSSTYVVVNEISTVATAYSIAGFATDALHVSSSGSALATTGIANAFAEIPNLETVSTGTPLGTTPSGGALWRSGQVTISVADILASCINTSGSEASGMPCNTLLTTALANGGSGTQPTETATAAINIAHHPGANLTTLMALQTANSPFQPYLNFVPGDLTMGITYTQSWLQLPYALAVDAEGDVWVTAEGATAGELYASSHSGGSNSWSAPYSGGGLVNGFPYGAAVDTSGNLWVALLTNGSGGALAELSSTGSPISPSSGYPGDSNNSYSVSIDASGHAWLPSGSTNSLYEYIPGTGFANTAGFTGGGMNEPYISAIDAQGNIWVTSLGYIGLSEFNSSGAANSHSPFPGSAAGMTVAGDSLAIDASGNIWVIAGMSSGGLFEFNSSGAPVSPSGGYSGGGLADSEYLAIDGAGNVFTSNYSNDNISEFNSTGTPVSPSYGWQPVNGMSYLAQIAIDGSGNVWVANKDGNSLVEAVGLAAPVVTPIAANLVTPYGLHAVNLP